MAGGSTRRGRRDGGEDVTGNRGRRDEVDDGENCCGSYSLELEWLSMENALARGRERRDLLGPLQCR